ncbi:MAG: S1 RNA-binding domain-containing protein [Planctomycetota bacterium]
MTHSPPPNLETLTAELDLALASEGAPARARGEDGLYSATVAGRSGDAVIVELSPRVQGMVPAAEFDAIPAAGTILRVALRGQEEGLWVFSLREARAVAAWTEMAVGSLVKATVVGLNKGGLECKVGSIRAFLPASQVALGHVEDLASFGGQTMICEVLEIDRGKKRVVVSRRAVLEEERRQARAEAAETIVPGAVLRGKVARLESYGAFVELAGGIEGLLHVSNISHQRVGRAEEVLKAGDDVEVMVLEVKEGGKRIGLGMKQLQPDPWATIADRLHEDAVVAGVVRRIADFGAFVEVEPGVEGLVHVSQLDTGRVPRPREVLKEGQELTVRVLSVDPLARRLSLSRLDARGAVIGSEEAAAAGDVDAVLDEGRAGGPIGTNLGALFKKALAEKSRRPG